MHKKLDEEAGPTQIQSQQKVTKMNQDDIIEELSKQMKHNNQPKKRGVRFQSKFLEIKT